MTQINLTSEEMTLLIYSLRKPAFINESKDMISRVKFLQKKIARTIPKGIKKGDNNELKEK